jgi:hypothetical protein
MMGREEERAMTVYIRCDGSAMPNGGPAGAGYEVVGEKVRLLGSGPPGRRDEQRRGVHGGAERPSGRRERGRDLGVRSPRLVGPGTTATVALIRFDSDGKVTTDFGGSDDVAFGVAIQADGRIVVAGAAPANEFEQFVDFGIARYLGR